MYSSKRSLINVGPVSVYLHTRFPPPLWIKTKLVVCLTGDYRQPASISSFLAGANKYSAAASRQTLEKGLLFNSRFFSKIQMFPLIFFQPATTS